MAIFHSYVSLPEGILTFCPLKSPFFRGDISQSKETTEHHPSQLGSFLDHHKKSKHLMRSWNDNYDILVIFPHI